MNARPIKVAVLALGRLSADTGGRTYLEGILGPLASQPGVELDVHVGDSSFERPPGCRVFHHAVPTRLGAVGRIAAEAAVARRLASAGSDVLLAPLNFLPPGWRGRAVVVQHNVLGLPGSTTLSGDVSPLRGRYRAWATAGSVRRANVTVVVSEYLRGLLLRALADLDPERVRVVPFGVDETWAAEARATPRGVQPTILVVAALWDYKRIDQTIAAFARAAAALPDTVLEIAGPGRPARRRELEGLAASLGVRHRTRFLGHVPHAALARAYGAADLVLCLSELESFGLPLLEGMASGTPVVARRIPAFVEVGGEAPIWVGQSATTDEMAHALVRGLSDSALRRERIQAGREQAGRFTWSATALGVASALRSASGIGADSGSDGTQPLLEPAARADSAQ